MSAQGPLELSMGVLIGSGIIMALVETSLAAQPTGKAAAPVSSCFSAQEKLVPFAGFVLAEHGGEIFMQRAGTVDGKSLPTRKQRYLLASVGKVFTQVAIGQLVDQKRVRLDAPIASYLPDLPKTLGGITVEQLLRHRSGVAPLIELTPTAAEIIGRAKSAHDLLPLVTHEPLDFPPGSRTEYSNGGYILLGAIIEAVTGLSYGDYLKKNIFDPLGMEDSQLTADQRTAVPMSRMEGPDQRPADHAQPIRDPLAFHGTPAGDSVSTAEDLAKLARALNGPDLLSNETKARLFPRRNGVLAIGQAGGREGANTYFMAYPEKHSFVVVLSNYDPPGAELLGAALGSLLSDGVCRPTTQGANSHL